MYLTSEEIVMLLRALHPQGGYSNDKKVGALQAKLSIMLEVAGKMGR